MRRRLVVLLIGVLALGALPVALVPVVVMRAERAAGGRAYCIQVAHPLGHYRPAESLFDLTGYRMRATSRDHGFLNNFHAVLFAERPEAKAVSWGQAAYEKLNWSFRRLRFIPVEGQGHAALGDQPICTPLFNFARRLPFTR